MDPTSCSHSLAAPVTQPLHPHLLGQSQQPHVQHLQAQQDQNAHTRNRPNGYPPLYPKPHQPAGSSPANTNGNGATPSPPSASLSLASVTAINGGNMNGNANGVAYSGDHTTPDAVYPNEQEHGHTHGHHHHDHSSSSTCVPSLIPPGIDPAHVDMRTFYPYQPNEVKHRKRTTRQQLKVLEDVYKYDTKPNASLRKRLAEELGMLPRGVQVWFQNRRAKTKTQARKAEAVSSLHAGTARAPIDLTSPSSPTTSTNPSSSTSSSSPNPDGQGELSLSTPPPETPSPAPSPSPTISLSIATGDNGWGDPEDSFPTLSSSFSGSSSNFLLGVPSAAELLQQRRPSLPMLRSAPSLAPYHKQSPGSALSPFIAHDSNENGGLHAGGGFELDQRRRKSIGANMKGLSRHPYAHLAQGINASLYGKSEAGSTLGPRRIRHGSMPHVLQPHQTPPPYYLPGPQNQPHMQRRPAMAHRLSVPAVHYPTLTSAHQRSASGYPYNSPGRPPIPLPPINASAGLNESYEFPPPSLSAPSTQPHSPSTASPPPISQSFVNGGLNGHAAALGRMGMHGAYAISSRSVPAPIPGPLPEPSFSFGMASTSPAIANASPSSSNTSLTVTHMEGGEGDVEDDASALSSNFDPYSRWNSLASMAGSDSSLTSYWSEAAQNGKESGENYDAARRGSVVSGVLPELFGELDVNGNGGSTPQPQPLTDSPREIHVVAPSSPEERRRASVGGSPHEGEAYAMQTQSTFQDQTTFSPHSYSPHQQQGVYPPQEQSGYVLHAHNGYPPPHEQNGYTLDEHSPYSSHDTGSYSPSSTSTVSAGNLKDGSPTMLRQSTSSELAHALQARPISGTEDVIPNHGAQLLYPSDFPDGPGPDHLDHNQSLSPKSVHYSPEPFPNPQSAYYSQQQQQPPPLVDYPYDVYNGTPMFPSGAIELDHMCVPSPMVMENMQGGDYMSYS